ncbi:hypothetical protein [Desulfatibacillum aliphaticivorans]|uniref:hypothetical protein n=1 Tax=Desulfatibacillum aliphaticivorans TaxID=218208 RepID=UPI00040AE860|nr:hypothetical protein [Desulfatibacillum aliphaticivorans]
MDQQAINTFPFGAFQHAFEYAAKYLLSGALKLGLNFGLLADFVGRDAIKKLIFFYRRGLIAVRVNGAAPSLNR